jgi:hypothetical protein
VLLRKQIDYSGQGSRRKPTGANTSAGCDGQDAVEFTRLDIPPNIPPTNQFWGPYVHVKQLARVQNRTAM